MVQKKGSKISRPIDIPIKNSQIRGGRATTRPTRKLTGSHSDIPATLPKFMKITKEVSDTQGLQAATGKIIAAGRAGGAAARGDLGGHRGRPKLAIKSARHLSGNVVAWRSTEKMRDLYVMIPGQ